MTFRIGEWAGFCSHTAYHPKKKIDRSNVTVEEYFKNQNIEWTRDLDNADLWIRRAELSTGARGCLQDELARIEKSKLRPTLFLISEPPEHAPVAYELADPRATMAVAPGQKFKMLWERGEWTDPQLENWKKRIPKACFIGRPTKERISFIKELLQWGVEIDILSRIPWPLPQWKGPAEDDVEDARKYQYRFVYETTQTNLCHSEKLFLGIRAGCVTFYKHDPNLNLDFCKDTFLEWNQDNWRNRESFVPKVLSGIEKFMFSNAWEIYSYREYYNRIIKEARRVYEENPLSCTHRTTPDLNTWRSVREKPEWLDDFDKGLELAQTGSFSLSLDHFESVKKVLEPGAIPQVQSNIGLACTYLGQYEKSEHELRVGLDRDAQSKDCWLNLGFNYLRQSRFQEALDIFLNLKADDYNNCNLYRNLAIAHVGLKAPREAIKVLEEGFKFYPKDCELLLDLAGLHLMVNQTDSAQHFFQAAYSLNPNSPRVQALLKLGQLSPKRA